MTCSGVYTALITPFDQKGEVDFEGFRLHITRQIAAGVNGLVILGSTAETASLSVQEKKELLKCARQEMGLLPLIAGCGSNSTSQTSENVEIAAQCGADYALVVSPYYNKPTQEGLFRHFEAVSKASPLPLILYNNPARSVVNIESATLQRLAELPNICGVKECSGNLGQVSEIAATIKKRRPEFALLSGDEWLFLPMLAVGADGLISGWGNLIPSQMVSIYTWWLSNQYEKAKELHLALTCLFNALKLESHPIPLKAALQLAGLPGGHPRLPLTPLQDKFLEPLKKAWSSVTQIS